jgi:hypothetical protein
MTTLQLGNRGIEVQFQIRPRDFSSVLSARNVSAAQAAYCSISWPFALRQCGWDVKLIVHLHLESRLRMSGVVTPFPQVPSPRPEGKVALSLLLMLLTDYG